jgi:hypothetical protein
LVFLAAFVANNSRLNKYIYPVILISVLIFQTFIILRSVEIQNYEEGFYSTNQSTTTVSNEYLNKWFIKPEVSDKALIVSGQGKVETVDIRQGKINLVADFQTEGQLQINYAYFPSWNADVNGAERKIDYEKNGLINLSIDKGMSNISVNYKQSRLHIISNIISAVSFVVLLYFLIKISDFKKLTYTLKRNIEN